MALIFLCVYLYMYVGIWYTCEDVYMCMHVYVYVHIYIYVQIYIYVPAFIFIAILVESIHLLFLTCTF